MKMSAHMAVSLWLAAAMPACGHAGPGLQSQKRRAPSERIKPAPAPTDCT